MIPEKEKLIVAIAHAIQDGATKYVTDTHEYVLPTPQRAGTLTQQCTYAMVSARAIVENTPKKEDQLQEIKESIERLFGDKVSRLRCRDDYGYEWEFLDSVARQWSFTITQDED